MTGPATGGGPEPETKGGGRRTGVLGVLGHFVWLVSREAWNRAARMIGRVRSPRYAAALVLGGAYFAWVFVWMPMENRAAAGGEPVPVPALLELGAPLLLVVLAGVWWLAGGYERALAFSPPEVQLLFPAPLRRRDLLHLRLLRAQQAILATSALFALFIQMGPLPWSFRFVTIWLLVSTLQLHQVASSLVRVSATSGRRGLRRTWLPVLVFLAVAGALAWTLWDAAPSLRAAETGPELESAFRAALEHPVALVILLPAGLVLGPALAPDLGAWLAALPAAVLVLVLHYVWVVRSDAVFEEVAAEAGRKRAETMAAFRSGRSPLTVGRTTRLTRPWFPLRPTGVPEIALFWKGFLDFTRTIRTAVVLLIAGGTLAIFGVVALLDSVETGAEIVVILGFLLTGLLTLMAPMAFRVDLRKDLLKVEVLRTYPLRGAGVVAAEVGASTAALALTQLSFLAVSLPFLAFVGFGPGVVPWILAGAAASPFLLTAMDALVMTIQNGVALVFPGWTHIGAEKPGGVEFMGQFLLTMLITTLLLAVTLVGPLVLAAMVAVPLAPLLGAWAAVPAAGALLLGIGTELVFLFLWLGTVYEKLDPAAAELLD